MAHLLDNGSVTWTTLCFPLISRPAVRFIVIVVSICQGLILPVVRV